MAANQQLPDLCFPSYELATRVNSSVPVALSDDCGGVALAACETPMECLPEEVDVTVGDACPRVLDGGHGDVPTLLPSVLNRGCHRECYAGLGGILVCTHEDGLEDDLMNGSTLKPNDSVPQHINLNTPASQLMSCSSQGDRSNCAPVYLPHQVGSTPGGAKPTPPGSIDISSLKRN